MPLGMREGGEGREERREVWKLLIQTTSALKYLHKASRGKVAVSARALIIGA
jgi:hypothetical protein